MKLRPDDALARSVFAIRTGTVDQLRELRDQHPERVDIVAARRPVQRCFSVAANAAVDGGTGLASSPRQRSGRPPARHAVQGAADARG
jgi:hypothetical protein